VQITSLPEQVQPFLSELLEHGVDVWLIGSRVNQTAVLPNDWDVLIFGNPQLFNEIAAHEPISGVDVLVVVDGDNFKSPWPRQSDGHMNWGTLGDWKWQRIDSYTASYEGTSRRREGRVHQRAVRITS
jgi:hypothetical protein